ncbi:hypothetical protein [Tengunoibacter tsumagoiensis]|uniref:Uncharacterized protein n=1 Tax=Tengunoibacter tsumagoiensis TaxID=2014871 RepID=A0A401ZVU6_9CHLR|nr:hypothetical protein [Tengunoibacter tsumagoiensis]GCE11029.1 hypothetical protein KTT_08880 [Tengunoibacter tsumagoiensis]
MTRFPIVQRYVHMGIASLALAGALVGGLSFQGSTVKAAGSNPITYGKVAVLGSTQITTSLTGSTAGEQAQVEHGEGSPKLANASGSNPGLPPPPTNAPDPKGIATTSTNPKATGFNGISQYDQRTAGTGKYANTQFSLEPPDQGLCAGNGYVVEGVNNAIAVYSKDGKLISGVEALSQFYGLLPEIDRTTLTYGQFISDPKCIYDTQSNRWFFTELEYDTDPTNGAPAGPSHVLIAVTQTSDPTKAWTVFSVDTTDDGSNGTPNHAGCPCFGDQPLIGTDSHGFYITTNEFTNDSVGAFHGAQVYALSKWKLVAAANHTSSSVVVAAIDASQALAPYGGLSYSLQPATSPAFAFNGEDLANQFRLHGVEYFLSALQFGAPPYQTLDNRIAVWGLTNTAALDSNSATPDLSLHLKVIGSETYGQPNPATQKEGGPTPLRNALAAAYPTVAYPLETLNTNDDRMNQVVFVQNHLWGAVNTILGDGTRTGIAYFSVRPSWTRSGELDAHLDTQGYVAVDGNNVFFPSIGLNASGKGVIVFTLVGPDYYPSSAYINIGEDGVSGNVHITGAGTGSDDGFTGYYPYATDGVARWGDYSAAVATPDGSIWTASEYIPSGPRTTLANWGTYITNIRVGYDD